MKSEPSASSQRVLVVDDEEDIRDGVARWLSAAGYTTITASDGEEGLRVAADSEPDAILLDVLMPRMDGMKALSCLRADERMSGIPVVMLSASLRDEQRALDAGARYFVPKPYNGRQLVSAVQASIGDAVGT